MDASLVMADGWPTAAGALLALGAAALLARLIRSASSTPRLGAPPPGAFQGAADAVRSAGREEGARTMMGLGQPPTARELLAGLASGSLTAEGVVSSMLERASVAHEMTNCIVPCKPMTGGTAGVSGSRGNPLRADALAAAKALDKQPSAQRGALHGLPFSVKECIHLAGKYHLLKQLQFYMRIPLLSEILDLNLLRRRYRLHRRPR